MSVWDLPFFYYICKIIRGDSPLPLLHPVALPSPHDGKTGLSIHRIESFTTLFLNVLWSESNTIYVFPFYVMR